MIKTLIKNVSSGFSVNKFFNDTKSEGFAVSKNTLHACLGYIEDAYLVFSVSLYDKSIRKVQSNPKKIYAIDTGLVNAYTLSSSTNFGHLFENLIYLHLRRKEHDVYYYLTKERYEVEFLSKDKQGNLHLIQVVWNSEDNETMAREERVDEL
jgi:predicted AAA+ superfamily ATPase